MNSQKGNIDLILRRFKLIGLFVLILFAFKNTNSGKADSGANAISLEQVIEVNNSAVLFTPTVFKYIDNTLAASRISSYRNINYDNFKINYTNSRVDLLLRICKAKFVKIKPRFAILKLYYIQTSLNNGEIPLIS